MKYTSLKSRLAAFGAAAALATQAHAQSSLINISASGTYQGGNTAIGGMPFTNGAPFTEYFSLLIPPTGLTSTTYLTNSYMSAYEVMTIGANSYTNTESSVSISYGNTSKGGGYTDLSLTAGSDAAAFGFDIAFNANLFGSDTSTLTLSDLVTILTDFQNNDSRLIWGSGLTDIFANANDFGSIVGTIAPVPEPWTLALAAFGGAGALDALAPPPKVKNECRSGFNRRPSKRTPVLFEASPHCRPIDSGRTPFGLRLSWFIPFGFCQRHLKPKTFAALKILVMPFTGNSDILAPCC